MQVDLFVEDQHQEAFLSPLVKRVSREAGVQASVAIRSARGGHTRALEELRVFQHAVQRGSLRAPDILIIGRDTNCNGFSATRGEVQACVDATIMPRCAIACPDPEIERWYMADPESFFRVVGADPDIGSAGYEGDYFKQKLKAAIQAGGHPSTLHGAEFALELVEEMDLYRAGRNDSALRHFLDDLRQELAST